MANWVDIDVNSLLPGQPFTSSIALAYEENPRALAEGAPGAPRIAEKVIVGSETLNNRNVDITITDLGNYKGISGVIWAGTTGSTLVGIDLKVSFSTDNGATFSAETEFTGDTNLERHFFVDFTTGQFYWMYDDLTDSGVAAGAGSSVDAVRFRHTLGSTQNNQIALYAKLHGGESAS